MVEIVFFCAKIFSLEQQKFFNLQNIQYQLRIGKKTPTPCKKKVRKTHKSIDIRYHRII